MGMMFKAQAKRENFMWLAVPHERPKVDDPAERAVDPVKHNFQEACR
jgi:hypothetical protein